MLFIQKVRFAHVWKHTSAGTSTLLRQCRGGGAAAAEKHAFSHT